MPSVGLPKEATVRPPAPSQISQTECRGLLRNYNYFLKNQSDKWNGNKAQTCIANVRQPSAEPPVEEGYSA